MTIWSLISRYHAIRLGVIYITKYKNKKTATSTRKRMSAKFFLIDFKYLIHLVFIYTFELALCPVVLRTIESSEDIVSANISQFFEPIAIVRGWNVDNSVLKILLP